MPENINLALAMALPPERAVEYFRAKGWRITQGWRDLPPAAHARAFTVTGVLKGEVLQDIQAALYAALADGVPFGEFVKRLRPQLKAKGWWGVAHDPETGEILPGRAMTPHRLRTVYQTNVQAAMMAGRYKAQLENADARPYWRYVAILDSRTRPRHRALAGRVFRYDDPAWGAIYPPNGYNCRCRVQALSADEFAASDMPLSEGAGRMETREVELLNGKGRATVTGIDDGNGSFFAPDIGFDHNPGRGAWGLDIALARRVQALSSREIRSQVWQALNRSPLRLAQYRDWVRRTLDARQAGHTAQVIGFVDESVADFWRQMQPETAPVSVVAMTEKRLVHADSLKHQDGGIALSRDQYLALPGIIAAPDEVYYDLKYGSLSYVKRLADGGIIYVAIEPATNAKRTGAIDAIVNAYRLPGTPEGVGRLANGKRFVRMGEEGR